VPRFTSSTPGAGTPEVSAMEFLLFGSGEN
jgi:hypothetical protein